MREHVYAVEWSSHAAKQFKDIKDKQLAEKILEVIEKEIAVNPLIGKPLSAPFVGVRSYRLGQLRILYKSYKEKLIIVILRVEHRRSVYRIS